MSLDDDNASVVSAAVLPHNAAFNTQDSLHLPLQPRSRPRFPQYFGVNIAAVLLARRLLIKSDRKIQMSERIQHTTDDGFDSDVLKSDKPVLVDYWAAWCGPCKMIAPILEEIASEYSDKIKVCKMDIDANQQTPARYGIRGIPTLMLFKNGEVEATKVGALSKSQLAAFLDSNI